nr:winged helix-turn-helix transcriptional regulator [Clostridia bacterium]
MSKNEFICDCNIIHEDIVKKVLNTMIQQEKINKISDFFKILGDSTRAKIIAALDQNEMCVCDIANVLQMTKSSVSHQLAILRKAKLVKYRKEGKTVYYSLSDNHVQEVFESALDHINHE